MSLGPKVFKYALGAAAILVAVLVVRSYTGGKEAEWQARADLAVAHAEEALAEGALARAEADSLQALADSLLSAGVRVETIVKEVIVNLPAPPTECEAFTLPRDKVILLLGEQSTLYRRSAEVQRAAADQLRVAEALARATADSLIIVIKNHPRPRPSLIPAVGLGATAGLCTTGQPCVAVGLTLSWEVKLF